MASEAELKQYIKRKLGHPRLKVAATEEQLDDCIADAKRWFAAWKGQMKEYSLAVSANINEYTLPSDVSAVVEIAPGFSPFDMRVLFSSFNFLDESIPYDLFRVPQAGGIFSTYAQTIQHVEMVKRLMSSEFDYDFDPDTRKFRVYPVPRGSYNCLITYKSKDVDFTTLDVRDEELFRNYALAKGKAIEGRLRSKFKSIPLAGGQTELDGPELLAEAKEELEKLQEQVAGVGGVLGIITG